jgi:flagellar biosynthesis/type III secretory pathway protein FliH
MGVTTGTASEHRYQLCRDEGCERYLCRIYKEGRRDGYDDGYRQGYTDGYAQGFPEGLASCPGPHGGSS